MLEAALGQNEMGTKMGGGKFKAFEMILRLFLFLIHCVVEVGNVFVGVIGTREKGEFLREKGWEQ